jgi:hypothetical protein
MSQVPHYRHVPLIVEKFGRLIVPNDPHLTMDDPASREILFFAGLFALGIVTNLVCLLSFLCYTIIGVTVYLAIE